MGTVLPFRAEGRIKSADEQRSARGCEIVIFPGVRIERQDKPRDPEPRHETNGGGKLDGSNARRRPRKTS